jgi:glutamate formiminotransferase
MIPVLEAVPNFSEGRDEQVIRRLVAAIEEEGSEVLDWSMDPDHHRSVITFVGPPARVEASAMAAARVAVEAIDLRGHQGLHPRIGALDVLPFVPLVGLDLAAAAAVARRVARRLAAELSLPSFLYAEASDPPGRRLADLRRGGIESLWAGFPEGRSPDHAPVSGVGAGPGLPHPTAGVTCVGARRLLLAWNVQVEGVSRSPLVEVARRLRETGGGFRGLRVLAFELEGKGFSQLSMNLEDLASTSPFDVFRAIEAEIEALGGRIRGTEVIGMVPDALVLPAARDRLGLVDSSPGRLLSHRLLSHIAARSARLAGELRAVLRAETTQIPESALTALRRALAEIEGVDPPGNSE